MPATTHPRLLATFRPQAWVDDVCHNVAGQVEFDATEKFLSLTHKEIKRFKEHDYDSDNLAEDLPERQAHDGPFEVDTDIDQWLKDNGIEHDRTHLTTKELALLRRRHGVKSPKD